ncbi:MAG TPA: hypothetical protein VKQ08_12330 [Cyclobacteriaceae bacterium]|nr:hypothetical protein [Cyclobacteriaceae bacterium]
MRHYFDLMIPIFADAISGAFGGAVIGNAFGGKTIMIIASIIGAAILIIYSVKRTKTEKPA